MNLSPRAPALILLAALLVLELSASVAGALGESAGRAVGVILIDTTGHPVLIRVEVEPGTGRVESNLRGDLYFRASLVMGCYEAALLAGYSPWSLDFKVTAESRELKPEGLTIIGPSLGLAIFTATYSALTGKPARTDILMTGVAHPDMLVGYVGGIYAKGEAAARYGYRVFLIPYLQNYTFKKEIVRETIGPYLYSKEVTKLEDVGLWRLNVTVAQARTVFEALEIVLQEEAGSVSDLNLKKLREKIAVPNSRIALAQVIADIMESTVERDIATAERELKRLYYLLSKTTRDSISESIARARFYLDLYRELRLRDYYFASIDPLYLAYAHSKYAVYALSALGAGDVRTPLVDAGKTYQVSATLAGIVTPATPDHLLSLGYAYYLLDEASEHLAYAASLAAIQGIRSEYALRLLAEASALSMKARFYTMIYLVDLDYEPPRELLESAVRLSLYQGLVSEYIWYYTKEFIQSPLLMEISILMSRSSRFMSVGAIEGGLVLSIEASTRGFAALALAPNLTEVLNAREEALRGNIAILLRRASRVPVMTIYYLELADLQKIPELRIYYLELALAYLRAYTALHLASGVGEVVYETFWAAAMGLEFEGEPASHNVQNVLVVEPTPTLLAVLSISYLRRMTTRWGTRRV